MKKQLALFLSIICGVIFLVACQSSVKQSSSNGTKIDFILDWTPNTNHTGLYVAKAKGYFKDAGLDVDIKLPPEDSSSDLIINGKAPFGIYFQDSMAKKLDKGAGITAVAAIVEHLDRCRVEITLKNLWTALLAVQTTLGSDQFRGLS